MKARVIGLIILAVVVAAGLVYQFVLRPRTAGARTYRGEVTQIKGFVGSEKSHFLDNPRVKEVLEKRYGLRLDYSKAGSIEMIRMPSAASADFLWPSSQVALELYKTIKGADTVKSEIIFNSPIVLYSWDIVTDALVAAGVAEKRGQATFVQDFPTLLRWVLDGKSWSSIGLPELYGKVSVVSTDPTKSNSGNMFSGLAANILHGDVVDEAALPEVLPEVVTLFRRMGYTEHSTGVLFDQYLQKGVGAYPLIVGYENQIVEFSLMNQALWPKVKDRLRILYPEPTVWSSHPIIALTPAGVRLLEALRDEELQRLAWEEHGFRTGLIGVQNDPSILQVAGIPETVTKVIPMPTPGVMETIIDTLLGGPATAETRPAEAAVSQDTQSSEESTDW